MLDLAIIIVTWNVRELVLQALHSLFADLEANGPPAQVFVVDSGSTDGTPAAVSAQFPQVKLIVSQQNLGFAAANNVALREIGFGNGAANNLPRAIYLLNPDTITNACATQRLFDALMSNSRVGLVGAGLSYADGSFQHSAFAFPGLRQLWAEFFPIPGRLYESRFNGRYPRKLYESDEPFSVDFCLGATMMLKREVIEQVGIFDEQFFMYCEEIDWAWRIHQAGWDIQCVPAAHIVHLGGQSAGQVRPRSVVDLWRSRLRLFHKHYPAWKLEVARQMIAVGMGLKIAKTEQSDLAIEDKVAITNAYQAVRKMALDNEFLP